MARAQVAVLSMALVMASSEGARISETATFDEYVAALGRSYAPGSPEYELRRGLFERRVAAVQEHNQQPGRLWTAGLNGLSDLTEAEFRQRRGWRPSGAPGTESDDSAALFAEKARRSGPAAQVVDWSKLRTTQEIQDQGACGSCWAVTSASLVQGHHEIHMNGTKTFSAQELINCVENPKHCGGDGGCEGATVELAMAYVQQNGLRTISEVPYQGRNGDCPKKNSLMQSPLVASFVGQVKEHAGGHHAGGSQIGFVGWSKLPVNKALPLMQALMDGPVGISVGAGGWDLYDSGIFNSCSKDTVVDHAVLLIGYGEQGSKFWKIQNSWGPSWGESGHIRLLRHDTPELDDQYCGVDKDPKVGTACLPYPDTQPVCGMCGLLFDSVTPHFRGGNHQAAQLRGNSI